MDFTIIDSGIAAIATANSGGPKIDLTEFRLGDAFNYTPDGAVDTALRGAETYTRGISNYYISASDTVVYILQVEIGAAVDFGEVGVYTSGGALFGMASFPALQTKAAGTLVEIICKLQFSGVATAITFEVNSFTDGRIVELADLTLLVRPELSDGNAYMTHSYDEGARNPVVAYRRDDDTWDFPTHCIPVVSAGVVGASSTTLSFDTDSCSGWVETAPALPAGKYVVQFLTGTLRGTARVADTFTGAAVTVADAWGSAPSPGDTFEVLRSVYSMMFDRFAVNVAPPYQVTNADRRRILCVSAAGDVTLPLAATTDPTFSVTIFNNSSGVVHVKMLGGNVLTALGVANGSELLLPAYGGAAEFLTKSAAAWMPLVYQSAVGTDVGDPTGYQYVEYQKSGPFVVPAGITSLQVLTAGKGGEGGAGAERCGGGAGTAGELKMTGTMWNSVADDQVYDNHFGFPVTPGETLTVEIDASGTRLKRGGTTLQQSLAGADGAAGVDNTSAAFDYVGNKYSFPHFLGGSYDYAADTLADASTYKVGAHNRRPFLPGAGGAPQIYDFFDAEGSGAFGNMSPRTSGVQGYLYPGLPQLMRSGQHLVLYQNHLNLTWVDGLGRQLTNAGGVDGYYEAADETYLATGAGFKGFSPYVPAKDGYDGANGFGHLPGGGGAGADPGFAPGAGGRAGQGYALLGWHGNVPSYPNYNRSSVRPSLCNGQIPSVTPGPAGTILYRENISYHEVSPLVANPCMNIRDNISGPSGMGAYTMGNYNSETPFFYAVHSGVAADPCYLVGVNGLPGATYTLQHLSGTIGGSPPADIPLVADAFGVVHQTYASTTTWSPGAHILRWSCPVSRTIDPGSSLVVTTSFVAFKLAVA
jgi:hypothetical protein